jgi:1-aminocyclopropane-1-carboxylate deaminase/D-cysteine desulfhydrase-like pyridoxal-dependent ACC family enzyme
MGTLGYVSMIDELDEQLAADAIGDGNTIDRMVVACGSGGGY